MSTFIQGWTMDYDWEQPEFMYYGLKTSKHSIKKKPE